MWLKRVSAGLIIAALGVVSVATLAAADETFEDGTYTLVLPGVGQFVFEIDNDAEAAESVMVGSIPDGYEVDDDDDDKAAWKDTATLSLEVEAKSDKVEGDYNWAEGDAMLVLPGGGSIEITQPDGDGNFEVTTTPDWWAFGSGSDWFVASDDLPDWGDDTVFFKVEADQDGIEIKPTTEPDEGFVNDLDDEDDEDDEDEEEEEELEEVEEPEIEEEDEEDGENNGRGRGRPDSGS